MSYSGRPSPSQERRQLAQSYQHEHRERARRRTERRGRSRTSAATQSGLQAIPAISAGNASDTPAASMSVAPWESETGSSATMSNAPAAAGSSGDRITLNKILDGNNLLATFDRLRHEKGQAPGTDGISYGDLTRSEIAAALRQVAKHIHNGTYRPQPLRTCLIPKQHGGHRELRLLAVVDRIVAAAVEQDLAPLCEAEYLDNNFGFRRGRSVLGLLARLEAMIRRHGLHYMVELDIRDAFPSTSIAAAVAECRALPIDAPVLDLIHKSINPVSEVSGPSGLPQGNPLSPQIFNLRLTRLLDRPFAAGSGDALLLRYADNLVLAAGDISHVRSAQRRVAELLAAGDYQLKTPAADPGDVRDPEDRMKILGYGVRYAQDQLTLHHGPESWQRLTDLFKEAHQAPHPGTTAQASVLGWLLDQGPTVEGAQRQAWISQVRRLAAEQGFRELGRVEDLRQSLGGADRWESARLRESGGC